MLHHPTASMSEWASACGWSKDGRPQKYAVQRALRRLVSDKLVTTFRGGYRLTPAGKKEAGGIT